MTLDEAIEIICKDYCKYPDVESGNKLADICDKCPMNKCEDLRWADRKIENSSEKPNNCVDDFFREPTAEERKAVAEYIDSISVPTGVNIFDLMDEPQTERSE